MWEADAFQQELLAELIAIDTTNPPGNEVLTAELIAKKLEPFGFELEIQTLAEGRANLIATLRGGDGPVVALSGHMDVVAANPEFWDSDPFALVERDGLLYGRGTSDMKGGISAMVAAAARFAREKQPFNGTLQLVFVADEELYASGTLAFLEEHPLPSAVIIGEPTGMDVCVAHRGVSRPRIYIKGESGHASAPHKTVNPIYRAARFALAVEEQNQLLAKKTHPVLPSPTVAATIIEGGEQSNSVPGVCTLVLDRRTLPGEDRALLDEEIRQMANKAGIPESDIHWEYFVETPGSQPLPGSTLGECCLSVLQGMELPSRLRDFGACCDQFAFIRRGVECVLVGPGRLEEAHTANEYIHPEQLALAVEFYYRYIVHQLQAPQGY